MRPPIPTPLSRRWPLLAIAGTLLALAALSLNPGAAFGQSEPSVTGVAVTSVPWVDNTYGLGETIRTTLTFSEAVEVSGEPRLKIKMDPDYGEKWVNYESGSGTTNLILAHEVVEPNLSTQGIAILANTLELNGGTIRSTNSTNALLAHTGQDHDADHMVDWQVQNSPPAGAPTITGGPTAPSFAERGPGVVATYTATDPNNDSIAWSVEGRDAAKFNISSGGALSFNAPPDFESPGDADGKNTYLVTVKATANGDSDTQAVTITVTDVDEAPTITDGPTAPSIAEHGTPGSQCCQEGRLCHPAVPRIVPGAGIIGTYTATDPENDSIVWSLGGTDAAMLSISAEGALSFKAPPNFDSPGDADSNNTYLVTVKATANDKSDTRSVTVTVTDGNDPPKFTQKKEELFVEEGYGHYLYDFGATEPQGDTMTFSFTGEDSEAFTYEHIQILGKVCYAALNLLHYNTEPDYENPVDADKDGVFNVVVRVSDGALTTELPITVTVTDVDEAPVIEGLSAVDFEENSSDDVGEYTATDPEGETPTLNLGGTDATSFTLTNGVLKFKSAPDFETKSSYSVTITASDGTLDATLDVAITIANVVEPPEMIVTGLTATASAHDTVTLKWEAPSGGAAVTGYQILRRALKSEKSLKVVNQNTGNTGMTWTDVNVSPHTKYTYRVRALGSFGQGDISTFANVTTPRAPKPGQATGLTATASAHDTVTLNWEAPTNGAAVTGYKILRRASNSEKAFKVVNQNTGSTSATWTDSNVSPRTKYAYRVLALGEHGEGEISPFANVTTPRAPKPGQVTGLTATASANDTITLKWEAPSNGATVTGYKILRRAQETEKKFEVVNQNTGSTSATWTDSNVSPGTKYTYRVRALGEHGEGKISMYANATTPE